MGIEARRRRSSIVPIMSVRKLLNEIFLLNAPKWGTWLLMGEGLKTAPLDAKINICFNSKLILEAYFEVSKVFESNRSREFKSFCV